MKQYRHIIWMMLLVCLTACQDDVIESNSYVNGDPISLVVGRTRADAVNGNQLNDTVFSGGTRFHLFGTDGKDSWTVNLMRAQAAETENNKSTVVPAVAADNAENVTVYEPDPLDKNNKIPVTYKATELKDVVTGDIELTKVFRTPLFSVYGVTVVDPRADDEGFEETAEIIEANNTLLEKYRTAGTATDEGIPVYNVAYADDHAALPDVMWSGTLTGLTPKNHAGKIVMPFKHTLSRLNFKAMILNDKNNTNSANQVASASVHSLTLKDYAGGALNMKNGLYSRTLTAADNGRFRNTVVNVSDFGDTPVVLNDETTEYIGSSLIFPTDGEKYDAKTGKTNKELMNHCITVDLVVTVGGVKKKFTDVPLGTNLPEGYEYMAFYPNMEYDITFTITTNAVVVTLTPQYYEYVPHGTDLDIFELGEPIDFGGVLWATHNLGATAADATSSALAWEHARGFYYQYGRNIPYYARGSVLDPYPNVLTSDGSYDYSYWSWDIEQVQYLYTDNTVRVPFGNTVYGSQYDASNKKNTHGAKALPYIPTLWETLGYEEFLKAARYYSPSIGNGQNLTGISHLADPYHATDILTATDKVKIAKQFAFTTYYEKNTAERTDVRYWYDKYSTNPDKMLNWERDGVADPKNSPSPKGWRLPKKDEFLSIFPPSTKLGDISFCGRHSDGTKGPHYIGDGLTEESITNVAENVARVYRHEVGTPNADVTEVTDYKGLPSVYVGIYQDGSGYNDLFFHNGYREGWGSICAIKCYGTDDAYAIKWEIEIADYDEVKAGKVNPARYDITKSQPFLGRGVVVISKYDLPDSASHVKLNYVKTNVTATNIAGGTEPKERGAEYTCHAFLDRGTKNGTFEDGVDREVVDWERPSGKLYLPIPGYVIVPSTGGQALIYPGCEGLYWTSTPYYDETEKWWFGSAVRIKNAGDYLSRYIYISEKEYAANGCNIRCVRDVKASY